MSKKGLAINKPVVWLIVLLALVVLVMFSGDLLAQTRESFEATFPGGKILLEKILGPKSISSEMEETEANKVFKSIRDAVGIMEDVDCIEKIDFSGVDEDFMIKFEAIDEKGYKTRLKVYKKRVFPYNFREFIYFYTKGEGLPIKDFEQQLLYKDNAGSISFIAEDVFPHIKYKQVCSTGEYLETVTLDDLEKNYNKVVISYNEKYTKLPEEKMRYKEYYSGVFKRREDGLWVRIKDDKELIARSVGDMLDYINDAREFKYKVNLFNIPKDEVKSVRG